jgi:hypothetical protein
MKSNNAANSDESIMQMMDKVSKPLLIATFLLSIFLAFGGADFLATNLGISKWIPIGLIMVAILTAFTELYFKFVVQRLRLERSPLPGTMIARPD